LSLGFESFIVVIDLDHLLFPLLLVLLNLLGDWSLAQIELACCVRLLELGLWGILLTLLLLLNVLDEGLLVPAN